LLADFDLAEEAVQTTFAEGVGAVAAKRSAGQSPGVAGFHGEIQDDRRVAAESCAGLPARWTKLRLLSRRL
jgi:hypothetical protein